jgi:hypothetical protein
MEPQAEALAEVKGGVEFPHQINVVVDKPLSPVHQESAVADLDLPLDRGAG